MVRSAKCRGMLGVLAVGLALGVVLDRTADEFLGEAQAQQARLSLASLQQQIDGLQTQLVDLEGHMADIVTGDVEVGLARDAGTASYAYHAGQADFTMFAEWAWRASEAENAMYAEQAGSAQAAHTSAEAQHAWTADWAFSADWANHAYFADYAAASGGP